MSRLYLVRHGEAAAGWGEDADPGLSAAGRSQAEAIAAELARLSPMAIVTSPLRRCRDTAAPLERAGGATARVDPAVGEVQAPTDDLESRAEWLKSATAGTWDDLGPGYLQWSAAVVDALVGLREDTVLFSHFVAINAAIGHATGRRDVVCSRVAYGSCTILDNTVGLRLVAAGAEAITVIR